MYTVVLSVFLTVTLKETEFVPLAGTVTVHASGVTPEITLHVPVAGTVRHTADPATRLVLEGTTSRIESVPEAVPALCAVKV